MKKYLGKPILLGLLFVPVAYPIGINLFEYDTVANWLITFLQLDEKRTVIQENYFTPQLYIYLSWASYPFAFVWLAFFSWSIGKTDRWLGRLQQFAGAIHLLTRQFWDNWKLLDVKERQVFRLFLSFLILLKIWLIIIYPIQVDEAFSYVFLVNRGSLVTATFYPGPNNHVGFLLICSWLDAFLPAKWALRLPSLFFTTFIYPLLYLSLRKYLKKEVLWLGLLLFSISEYSLYYSTHGRGYALQLLCLSCLIACWWKWRNLSVNRQNNNTDEVATSAKVLQFFVVLFGTLGCYSVPSFVYFLFPCGLWAWWHFSKLRWQILGQAVAIGLASTLLYSPILLLNDWADIAQNPWVKPLNWSDFLPQFIPHWFEVHGNLLGLERAGGWIILATYFASWRLSAQSEGEKLIKFLIFFSIICYLPSFFQRVLPFTRVFWAKSLADFMLIAWVVLWLLKNQQLYLKQLFLAVVCGFFIIPSFWETGNYIFNPNGFYPQLELALGKINMQNNESLLITEDTYAVKVRYFFSQKGRQGKIGIENFSGQDWLILTQGRPHNYPLDGYRLFLENKAVKIYQKAD